MSVSMDALFYAENADDRPLEQARVASVEDSAQVRRERAWKAMYPNEWAEWVRLRPLMDPVIDFWAGREFDFSDFLKEVGRQPSPAHRVVRRDKGLPYRQGNIRWRRKKAKKGETPYLNAKQAAAYLGISLRTLYNNRRHIPSLPGFRTLMFDPKVLDEVRASMKFRTKRLAEQRKSRDRKLAA